MGFRTIIPLCCTMVAFPAAAWSYSGGAATCSYPNAGWLDMGSGQSGTGGFSISVEDQNGHVAEYVARHNYTVRIRNSVPYKGFLLQAVMGDPGTPGVDGAGSFSWSPDTLYQHGPCLVWEPSVTHTFERAHVRRNEDVFTWTAPAPGTGIVTFHLVGVISRFNWYGFHQRITVTLRETAVAVVPLRWTIIRQFYR